jgi:hypothetical protein
VQGPWIPQAGNTLKTQPVPSHIFGKDARFASVRGWGSTVPGPGAYGIAEAVEMSDKGGPKGVGIRGQGLGLRAEGLGLRV